jgi:branched-chain amino acid transport system ATP-binding protein
MLQIRNLKVSYDGILAVSKVDLDVRAGSIVALVGGNGNGKSTTLRAVAGLNAADQGSIFLKVTTLQRFPHTSASVWACPWFLKGAVSLRD